MCVFYIKNKTMVNTLQLTIDAWLVMIVQCIANQGFEVEKPKFTKSLIAINK